MSSFDPESLLTTFVLDESTLPPPPSDDDDDVLPIEQKDEPKKDESSEKKDEPKKQRTRSRETKAKPESKDKTPTAKEIKERYENIKHKSPFAKERQLPPPPAVEEGDDKKTIIIKKAISALKKKVETIETKCEDVDFLMTQTSHLLSDYEGFNNDVEDYHERLNVIDDLIKNQDDRLTDLVKWKSKQMTREISKPKDFTPFEGGIVLIKDKILHLKMLLSYAHSDDQKQHMCEYHLPIIYQLLSQYNSKDWEVFYNKHIKDERSFEKVVELLLKITDELMLKFIGKKVSIPKFKF